MAGGRQLFGISISSATKQNESKVLLQYYDTIKIIHILWWWWFYVSLDDPTAVTICYDLDFKATPTIWLTNSQAAAPFILALRKRNAR